MGIDTSSQNLAMFLGPLPDLLADNFDSGAFSAEGVMRAAVEADAANDEV